MRFSTTKTASAAAFMAGVAIADPLAVITPCSNMDPITVTEQFQTVSTCGPATTACVRGSCITTNPMESFAWVSTTIPGAWDGTTASSTLVTVTEQPITVSVFQSTVTKYVTPAPTVVSGITVTPTPTPAYMTIAKNFVAPFNEIGALGIQGWGGSGLCEECEANSEGVKSQIVDVIECRAAPAGTVCMEYAETWISSPAPTTHSVTEVPVSISLVAPSAGVYTFTFDFVAPAETFAAGNGWSAPWVAQPSPYYAHVTKSCDHGGEVIDFTTTVTKTVYYTQPYHSYPASTSSAVPYPTGNHGWSGWPSNGGNGGNNNNNNGGHTVAPANGFGGVWADLPISTSTTGPIVITTSSSSSTSAGNNVGPDTNTTTTSSYTSSSSTSSSSSSSSSTSTSTSTSTSSSTSTTSSSSNTTVAASTTITPTSTATINTSAGYVIVSPSSCPPSTPPTGSPIGQSNSSFSDSHGGLQYQQFPGSQFILQNATSGPFYVDLSNPSELVISDTEGDTLIIYSNGTFVAFAGSCELEIVGTWQAPPASSNKEKRDVELETRQVSSALCNDVQFFCNNGVGVAIAGFAGGFACASIGASIGADIGGAIGFLGNIFGPEVGIPTTLAGVVLGKQLGGFLAQRFGQALCGAAASDLVYELCQLCPSTTQCGPGTITCNGGPCQDALSDPNNCGKCGNVCPSGICQNAQCSAPACNGSTCFSLNSCGSGCFCFETASGTGFCGPSEPCAPLPDCSSDSDCSQGWVCATGTCCGRNVCLQACGVAVARRELLLGRNLTELYTNGLGGVTSFA